MSLIGWSWLFLVFYIGLMLALGVVGQRRVANADDFAVARGAYSPLVLAFAYAATTASGSTFLGTPALTYEWGMATMWGKFLYPMGVYFGVLISMRLIATAGNRFHNRSISEFLGDRYQSGGIRVLVSLMSLMLLFYLTGQLVSGIVMFNSMLGVSPFWALLLSTAVLLFYVTLGGAHADILTDSVQGVMMLCVAVLVIVVFLTGLGVEGGFGGIFASLGAQDEKLLGALNPGTPLYHSWWSMAAIFLAHIPLGLLPHLGNKLWALKGIGQQKRFIKLAFLFGLTLGMMGLAGFSARAILGDALYADGMSPNQALPMLFITLLPPWFAALVGVSVLSAIMSTADGLVISSSQIVANDLYRRTWVPIFRPHLDEQELDRRVLRISRISTVLVLLGCMGMAWALLHTNITLIIWIGTGGMMSAFAGPLVVGALWKGVTKSGAYCGLISGFLVFIVLHGQMLNPQWFAPGILSDIAQWMYREAANPFSCAAVGEIVSCAATVVVSKLTRALPESHVRALFQPDPSSG